MFSWSSSPAASSGRRSAAARNRSISAVLDEPGGQGAELVDVLLAGERPGAQRVRVGDGDLVGDDGAVGQRDLHAAAEGLLGDVQRVVAAGPLRVLHGGDLVPQRHGVRAGGALRGVGVDVVPGAVLQGDGEDVRDRVVQGLAAGRRVVLLRVVGAGADHVVRVVAGVDQRPTSTFAGSVTSGCSPCSLRARSISACAWYSAECSLV